MKSLSIIYFYFPIEYKNSKGKDTVWTEKEKEVFRDRFVQHPKNFVIISQFLENKTVSECIHYYYMSKKTENYKQLVRKHQARQRGAKGALKKVCNFSTFLF